MENLRLLDRTNLRFECGTVHKSQAVAELPVHELRGKTLMLSGNAFREFRRSERTAAAIIRRDRG